MICQPIVRLHILFRKGEQVWVIWIVSKALVTSEELLLRHQFIQEITGVKVSNWIECNCQVTTNSQNQLGIIAAPPAKVNMEFLLLHI